MTRRAVIDIGSNTVKLLIADVTGGAVVFVSHRDTTTRLGQGVQRTRQLTPRAIECTVVAIRDYVAAARVAGATDIRAIATSAVRSATNAAEFLAAVRHATGLAVEVISGEREAELTFRGAASDPAWNRDRLLVMDVGGGSAEWILGQAGCVERAVSLPVGAVRLLEQFPDDDFAGLSGYLRELFHRQLAPFRAGPWRLIATGGGIVTLAKIAGQPLDHARLTSADLRALVSHLHALPLTERRHVPGLPAERADIIVPGGAVYLFAMEALGATELTTSVRALRYGVLLT